MGNGGMGGGPASCGSAFGVVSYPSAHPELIFIKGGELSWGGGEPQEHHFTAWRETEARRGKGSISFGVCSHLPPWDFGRVHQPRGGGWVTVLGFGGVLGFLMGKMRVIPPRGGVKAPAAPDSGLAGTELLRQRR